MFAGKNCDWAVVTYAEEGEEDAESKESSVSTKDLCNQLRATQSVPRGDIVHCKRAEESLPERRHKFNLYNDSSPAYENLSEEDANILRHNNQSLRHWQKYKPTVFSIPKTALYKELLPLLPNYRRIFLLDEDILLHNFGSRVINYFYVSWFT